MKYFNVYSVPGKSWKDKVKDIRAEMSSNSATSVVVYKLDEVACKSEACHQATFLGCRKEEKAVQMGSGKKYSLLVALFALLYPVICFFTCKGDF